MPKTLLLADDSVTIQKVVGISFANEDVVLLTVDNGDDAIARAREARPDLVLADILMPGKDGYEVCEAIKSDAELRHVPVLLLSGTFESFDEERARRAGADGHITKPFEAQALVDQVNELLARSAAVPPQADPASEATILVDSAEPTGSRDAYDFFDEEEMAQTAPSAPRAARVDASPASAPTVVLGEDDEFGLGGEALELEAAVEEELRPAMVAPALRTPGRPDVDPRATVVLEDSFTEAPPAPPRAPAGYEETFDFSFDPHEVGARPAPHGETLRAASEPRPAAPPEPAGLFSRPPVESAPRPSAPIFDADPVPQMTPPPPPRDPGDSRRGLESRPMPPQPPPIPSAAIPAVESRPSEPQRVAVTTVGAPAGELSAAMRQQLHETLEKIAWEAFGDLSERIVREALERVEAVAWEVIPQMAEVLIREEISRLKDGD